MKKRKVSRDKYLKDYILSEACEYVRWESIAFSFEALIEVKSQLKFSIKEYEYITKYLSSDESKEKNRKKILELKKAYNHIVQAFEILKIQTINQSNKSIKSSLEENSCSDSK